MHAQAIAAGRGFEDADPAAVLLRHIALGDRGAMDRFYRMFQDNVFRLALSRLNDFAAASDVLNETMLKVWLEAKRFRGESGVLSWVLGIAFNKSMDQLRGRYRHQAEELDPAMPEVDATDMALVLERMDDMARVQAAMTHLTVIQRTALHLAFFEDLTYADMARVLGCPEGTVKTRLFHAKQALKRLLSIP